MIKSLRDLVREKFRSDEFIATSAVFPNIDKDRLAKALNLEAEGESRGKEGMPETSSMQLDHIELKAISRVEELRRKGLENFETNRRVYSERLNWAVSARILVETEANKAKAQFAEEVTRWKAIMVTPRERVMENYRWREKFREINCLGNRPAIPSVSWANMIGLSSMMILVESVGNAYLFSQNNPLGILGGWFAAFLISLANVAMCTFMGRGVRYINMKGVRNLHLSFFGLLLALTWLAFALVYNASVAHFRDAVESTLEWREAGSMAIRSLIENSAKLNTMESYVLFLLGFLISIFALL